MRCKYCGKKTVVISTKVYDQIMLTTRYRKCEYCHKMFVTYETVFTEVNLDEEHKKTDELISQKGIRDKENI